MYKRQSQYVIEDLAKIPVRVELVSEFRYRNPLLDKNGLVVVISQSGETADSLAALREAKEKWIRTLGIVNVVGSSIAREADSVFYTLAGPEIAVATTKAYSTQLVATYALAIQFAKVREEISEERYVELIKEVKTLPEKIAKILEDKERIQWFASKQVNAHDVFFVGRGKMCIRDRIYGGLSDLDLLTFTQKKKIAISASFGIEEIPLDYKGLSLIHIWQKTMTELSLLGLFKDNY